LRLPQSGAAPWDLADELRVTFCERYAIYCLPRLDEIIIVRVLHGSQDVDSIASEGGFVE